MSSGPDVDMPAVVTQAACVAQASAYYGVHRDLVEAVLRTEGGKRGQVRVNRDGSYDMGPMQINSVHLPELARYGITAQMLVNDECLNIHVGAYYLKRHLVTTPGSATPVGYWRAVGRYHSSTPDRNRQYQGRVWLRLVEIRRSRGDWSGATP